eukprot:COSAG01_NODE_2142_length_8319_cov_19.391653_5_plen_149_part_00
MRVREPAADVNDDSGFDADFPEAGDDDDFAACFEDTEQDDGEVADVEQAAAEDDSAATADAGQGVARSIYHYLSTELSSEINLERPHTCGVPKLRADLAFAQGPSPRARESRNGWCRFVQKMAALVSEGTRSATPREITARGLWSSLT